MNDLTIITQNGKHFIDSRDVAVMVDKLHHNLLREINNYIEMLKKSTEINFDFNDFFRESTYVDGTGRTLPRYLLTKKGCQFIANKLTGQKGVLFTAAYVTRFNELEEKAMLEAVMPRPQLAEYNNAAKLIVGVMTAANVPPAHIAITVAEIYAPLGIPVGLKDMTVNASFSATEIARINGIMSASGRPHFQAVNAIITMLEIGAEHRIIYPRRHNDTVSVFIHYDEYVLDAVMAWVEENGYPCEIPFNARTFKVRYKYLEEYSEEAGENE